MAPTPSLAYAELWSGHTSLLLAAEVARRQTDCHFVIFGTGRTRAEALAFIEKRFGLDRMMPRQCSYTGSENRITADKGRSS